MKLFRYRKPSLKTMLGITRSKRRVKRMTGISMIQGWTRPNRIKQRFKQNVGIYGNPVVTTVRQTWRGRIRGFFSGIKL